MSTYTLAQVGSLCSLVNGKAFRPEDWSTNGAPIIRIQDLNNNQRAFNHWAGTLKGQVIVEPNDVLLAWSGTPGISFGAHIWSGPAGILDQHIFRVDLDERLVTKDWWVRAVNSRLNPVIQQAHGGVGLQHVTRRMVDDFLILIPPISEQRRIAAILDQADILRTKLRVAVKWLDGMVQANFIKVFGDPTKPSQQTHVQPFGALGKIQLGKMLYQRHQTGAHKRSYLRNANVRWLSFDLSTVFEMNFDQRDREKFSLQKGDLLIREGGEPGRAAIWDGKLEECYFQKALHRFRPNLQMALPEYLAQFLWQLASRGGLKDYRTTSTIAHLTKKKLETLMVPLPPLKQ